MTLVLPTGSQSFVLPPGRVGQERVLRYVCEAIWGDTRERRHRKSSPAAADEHSAFRTAIFLPHYYRDSRRRLGTWR